MSKFIGKTWNKVKRISPFSIFRYEDLQKAFGVENFVKATEHFIRSGFNEKRIGN